jgi:hypothetical protein
MTTVIYEAVSHHRSRISAIRLRYGCKNLNNYTIVVSNKLFTFDLFTIRD